MNGEVYDVVVIGGGITGAGAANQLAADGFSVLLVERGDFGGATTSRTSRLQYSGLSYFSAARSFGGMLLRPGQVLEAAELARRAMRDRSAFVRATPERVRPVPFHFPLYNDGSIPVWKARTGFWLLEQLDRGGVPLDAQLLSPAEARQDPLLRELRAPDRLSGVLRVTEYQFDWPERICVDTVLNAQDSGAVVMNRVAATRLQRAGSGMWLIDLKDMRSASLRTVRARAVVNAAGVWADELAAASSLGAPNLNQGAKGTNVMVRLPEPFRGRGFETLTRGGEPFYVIPWDDLHYFGPRNAPHDGSAAGFRATEAEIAALIDEMNHLFPRLRLTRKSVLYSWAGVRPRTARRGVPAGGPAVEVHDLGAQGVHNYFVHTGGLLMTHRAAGRRISAAVGRRVRPAGRATPLRVGARMFPENTNSPAIAPAFPGVRWSDLRRACAEEHVHALDDLMFRRVRLGWGERLGCDVAFEVARGIRGEMGWSIADADAAATRYAAQVREDFGAEV